MDEITGRVALVTGGSRGIGRAIAIAMAREGVRVVVNYKSRAAEAQQVAEEIGGTAIQADVSVPTQVDALVAAAGKVDILVNNAGIAQVRRPGETTIDDWDQILNVNLRSCFLMTEAVLPGMRERSWGRIINLSSVAAHVGGVVGPHYAASKAGMLGLTHFYASALVKEGITVNAISPALIETEMVTSNLNASPDRIPLGRFGSPEETAEIAVILAKNSYMTGQTIHVNGGLYQT